MRSQYWRRGTEQVQRVAAVVDKNGLISITEEAFSRLLTLAGFVREEDREI